MHHANDYIQILPPFYKSVWYTGWLKKVAPSIFTDFSEVGVNINIKIYTFVQSVYIRFCAK